MEIKAPLTGTVLRVLVQTGDEVADGDPLVVMESMKMEIYVNALFDGTVEQILRAEGDVVQAEEPLIVVSD